MSRLISKAEGFEVAYEAFQHINFASYDYHSIKQSMIEYVKLYFPEFNDFIESSEFIALLELFAYLGEIAIYRLDMNAHETSIEYAQRKQSVLRLAKLISYNASRNTPARGLVKITSISTTETVYDVKGVNLSNRIVRWNDPNDPSWKDKFHLIMGRILQQQFGTVSPNERIQVNDVLFELYPLNNKPLQNGVVKYRTSITGTNYDMELVPIRLSEYGPIEARPQNKAGFTVLYGSDGLGDQSDSTGFFCYTKQGVLNKRTTQFDGVLPNQTYTIGATNVNNSDVWVNNIDPVTLLTTDDGTYTDRSSGEWSEVDLANAQNIIFNTNPVRTKYEVQTLEDDDVRIIFGDGDFSDIPAGTFDIWFRTSTNDEVYIPKNGIVEKNASLNYTDSNGRQQTINFTFSLVSALQNSAPSEDIEHIRRTAPSIYYTQDRMVNAPDYNAFPLQDPSILKLRTINRTFAGDTKYESRNDASQSYENVKVFGDDLSIFFQDTVQLLSAPGTSTANVLIQNYIEPLMSTIDFYVKLSVDYSGDTYRREFDASEIAQITTIMNSIAYPWPVGIRYKSIGTQGQWTAVANDSLSDVDHILGEMIMLITLSPDRTTFTITYWGKRVIAESPTTNFFYDNSGERLLSFDTLNLNTDTITVLKANESSTPNVILSDNVQLKVLQVERHDSGMDRIGLPNLNRVSVSTYDINGDQVPEDINIPVLVDSKQTFTINTAGTGYITLLLSRPFLTGYSEVSIDGIHPSFWIEGGLPIIEISSTAQRIVVAGNVTSEVRVGDIITLRNSTVTGSFIVGSVLLVAGPNTTIYIERNLNTVDPSGNIRALHGVSDTMVGSASSGILQVYGRPERNIIISKAFSNDTVTITVTSNTYVYFQRDSIDDKYNIVNETTSVYNDFVHDSGRQLTTRRRGRSQLNFLWQHYTTQYNLVDPSPTNIHDMFIITRSYYGEFKRWVDGYSQHKPTPPTPQQLRTSYRELLQNGMISDSVITQPGKIKLVIGGKSIPELQAKIKIIRTDNRSLTDNQIKIRAANLIREFFDIRKWEFGETFFYTELDTYIQSNMPSEIASTIIVPISPVNQFGDLYQIYAAEDEIFQVDIGVEDIEIIESYNATNMRQ